MHTYNEIIVRNFVDQQASSFSENVFTGTTNCTEDEVIATELCTYQDKIK